MGFPGDSVGKESTCNVGYLGLTHGLGRSSGEGHGNPLQYSCLDNLHGHRSLAGYSLWGEKESDTTEWLSTNSGKHPTNIYRPLCYMFPQPRLPMALVWMLCCGYLSYSKLFFVTCSCSTVYWGRGKGLEVDRLCEETLTMFKDRRHSLHHWETWRTILENLGNGGPWVTPPERVIAISNHEVDNV